MQSSLSGFMDFTLVDVLAYKRLPSEELCLRLRLRVATSLGVSVHMSRRICRLFRPLYYQFQNSF